MTKGSTPRARVLSLKAFNRSLSEEELIRGISCGNPAIASEFVRRYGARISRWVWRLLGADSDHDDVVQQVYLGLISSIDSIKDPEKLDAWVDSVVIRTVRKEIRRRKIKRTLFLMDNKVEGTCDLSSPLKFVYIRSFYSIMESLPTDDRVIFILRYLERCSLDEIAERGRYSLSTAKRRLRQARARFKKLAMKQPMLISLLQEIEDGI